MSIRSRVGGPWLARLERPGMLPTIVACTALLPSVVLAQCVEGWLPGDGVTGVNATPSDVTAWDPDGPGPRGPMVVVCGEGIICAGTAPVRKIAAWDSQSDAWQDLNSASFSDPQLVRGLPDGRLLAWSSSYGVFINGVSSAMAVYDGSSWTSLAPMLPAGQRISCVAMASDGDIVVGGVFSVINGVAAQNIARWNGSSWSAIGSGISTAVTGVDVLLSGDVVALANVTIGSGDVVSSVRRFSAGAWTTVGPAWTDKLSVVRALPNGEFVVARGGQYGSVYRLETNSNGTFWVHFGSLPLKSEFISDIQPIDANSVMVVGNGLQLGGTDTYSLVRLPRGQAAAGQCLSISGGYGKAALLSDGQFVATASTTKPLQVGGYVARWTGATWGPLGQSSSRAVSIAAVAHAPDGATFASGMFVDASGATHVGLAKQEAGAWEPLAAGAFSFLGPMLAGPGGLLACGSLSTDPSPTRGIAVRRNGVWTNTPLNTTDVRSIAQTADGTLFVGGRYDSTVAGPMKGVAKWDGAQWVVAGLGLTKPPTFSWPSGQSEKSTVNALCALDNGQLVAVGDLSLSGTKVLNGVALWNGSEWLPMGAGIPNFDPVTGQSGLCAAQMSTGDVLIGGGALSTTDNTVAIVRWTGSSWVPFASCVKAGYPYGAVSSLARLTDGRIVASGTFDSINGVAADGIAIWDGAWHAAAEAGPAGGQTVLGRASVLPTTDGGFIAFGDFNTMNGDVAARYAKWGCITPCVADFNGSGAVSFEDFDAFVAAIESGSAAADINGDGFLTVEDFDAFVTAFEAGC